MYIYIYIYNLFLAVLGHHYCARAFSSYVIAGLFSSCGEWASHRGGFSCCRAWTLLGTQTLVGGNTQTQ